VVSGVPDVSAALGLTAAQQVAIGFSCDGTFATYAAPITSCNGVGRSKLIELPQAGKENDDHNPDRVKPRSLFNVRGGDRQSAACGSDSAAVRRPPGAFRALVDRPLYTAPQIFKR
jgi:hypothetical protein